MNSNEKMELTTAQEGNTVSDFQTTKNFSAMENATQVQVMTPATQIDEQLTGCQEGNVASDSQTTKNFSAMENVTQTQVMTPATQTETITGVVTYTVPEGMELYRIYPGSELKAMGFYITTLGINRPLNAIALKLKRQSISDCKGVLTPSLVVSALDCVEQGLEVNMPQGVTDLSKVLVIYDGSHREHCVDLLNKSKGNSFENYYHLPINNQVSISRALRSINLVVRPWRGVDMLTSTLLEKAESGVDLSRLTWYQFLCGSMSEKVAWQWASLSTNRPPIKSKIDKASGDDAILKEIAGVSDQADIDRFNAAKEIFEELNRTLTKEELGWAEIPAFFIKKHSSLTSGKMSTIEAKELLLKFCRTITQDVAISIRGYKGGKGRAENVTKILNAQYTVFENKLHE